MRTRGHHIVTALLAVALAAGVGGCWDQGKSCRKTGKACSGSAGGGSSTLTICPAVDVVFILDTSGSMDDEAAALCAELPGVEADLRRRGLETIRTVILGITETTTISATGSFASSPEFDCLEDTVVNLLGTPVPGNPPAGYENLDPFMDEAEEFWAPGSAIVAQRYPWLTAGTGELEPVKIVVPISDESPQTGDDDCEPEDGLSIDNAIDVAVEMGVLVSPIIGTLDGRDPCIEALAQRLADGTGGTFALTTDPGTQLGKIIFDLVEDACQTVSTKN